MSNFAPAAVLNPHHFEVSENGRGYWIAKDTEGLVGGVFRTQKDALRFALFEAAGDSACVTASSATRSCCKSSESYFIGQALMRLGNRS